MRKFRVYACAGSEWPNWAEEIPVAGDYRFPEPSVVYSVADGETVGAILATAEEPFYFENNIYEITWGVEADGVARRFLRDEFEIYPEGDELDDWEPLEISDIDTCDLDRKLDLIDALNREYGKKSAARQAVAFGLFDHSVIQDEISHAMLRHYRTLEQAQYDQDGKQTRHDVEGNVAAVAAKALGLDPRDFGSVISEVIEREFPDQSCDNAQG